MLETEFDNLAAIALYESLGFIREKRLHRFYLNGKDAFRLVLAISPAQRGAVSVGMGGVGAGPGSEVQTGREADLTESIMESRASMYL